jgi:CheY-like chemotaxis protein
MIYGTTPREGSMDADDDRLALAERAPAEAVWERAGEPTTPLILVVDDDALQVELLRDMLELRGYRVAEAAGGDAMAVARREGPDLILLDMLMPDVGGGEVCAQLRAEPGTAAIPIVALSASAQRLADATLPVNDRMLKPFDLDDLYATVARWVKPG